MRRINVIILRTAGTNCDRETAFAFEKAGAETELVHINALRRREKILRDYQILAIPGGFTYGDDIASGKIVLQGFSNAVPGYKISNYQWASFVSQADAAERGIEYMSNDIRSRVALYFARAPDQKPPMARD